MRVYVQKQASASDPKEYPSLIDTFWRTHTVDGVFVNDEDRRIYVSFVSKHNLMNYREIM